MNETLIIPKLTIIITTRCNLRCKLCCEYVPQNQAFPDITIMECKNILEILFKVTDKVNTLHLSGGGEPFLHPNLSELVNTCMEYSDKFDTLMLFTNSTIMLSEQVLETLKKNKSKLIVQVSHYGINPKLENEVLAQLQSIGLTIKLEKYYGDSQSFGGWVDFGMWNSYKRTPRQLENTFSNCAVSRDMRGNWRTRDGKVHWCSRSQRGTELGLLPDFNNDYVDLFDGSSIQLKREKFLKIMNTKYINACDYCSGHQGTSDNSLRFQAAEQMR